MRKTRAKALRAYWLALKAAVPTRRGVKKNWVRGRPLATVRVQLEHHKAGWLKEQDRERRHAWKNVRHRRRVLGSLQRASMGGGGA